MKLSEIGEFGLIERIRWEVKSVSPNVLLGLGDDAAVLRVSEGMLLLATTDMMVEGVHFLKDLVSPYALGRKAMASSLSDIAAMGGVPEYALISLALPKETPYTFVEELYRGLQEEASAFAVEIVGGDTSSSSRIILALTILGEVEAGWYVPRAGSKAGDLIWVTGRLGASSAGFHALKAGFRVKGQGNREITGPYIDRLNSEEREALAEAIGVHLFPAPRIHEGRAVASMRLASAMIDLSDGLAKDLAHICRESGVQAKVFQGRIPLHPAAAIVGKTLGEDPFVYALEGGEDYELLFTSPLQPGVVEEALRGLAGATCIGEVVEGEESRVWLVQPDGSVRPLRGGYDHFRS